MPKIKNKIKKVIPVLFLLMVFGCVEEVDVDPGEARLVAVNGILTQEEVQELSLCWSAGGDKKVYVPVSDAEVILSCEGQEVGRYGHLGEGKWRLAYAGIPGRTYSLQVVVPGHDHPVSATTTIPEGVIGIYRFPQDGLNSRESFQSCIGIAVDSEDENSVLWIYADYPANSATGDSRIVMASVMTTDHPGVDMFNVANLSVKEYISLVGGYPLNGDILGHYSYETLTTYPEDRPLFNRYLRIAHTRNYIRYLQYGGYSAKDVEGNQHLLLSEPYTEFVTSLPLFKISGSFPIRGATLHAMKVSPELDKYLLSGWSKAMEYLNGDFTMLYDTENTYTNVENGIGIFAGANKCTTAVDSAQLYTPTLIPGAPWVIH